MLHAILGALSLASFYFLLFRFIQFHPHVMKCWPPISLRISVPCFRGSDLRTWPKPTSGCTQGSMAAIWTSSNFQLGPLGSPRADGFVVERPTCCVPDGSPLPSSWATSAWATPASGSGAQKVAEEGSQTCYQIGSQAISTDKNGPWSCCQSWCFAFLIAELDCPFQ